MDAALLDEMVHLPIVFTEPLFSGPVEMEPNDEFQQANGPLVLGATYYGALTDENDVNDFYSIRLSSPQTVSIRLTNIAEGDNVDLVLRDESMAIKGASTNPDNEDEAIQLELQPGRYYVQIFE